MTLTKLSIFVLCLICFMFSACVSKRQYVDLETDLTQQLGQERQKLNNTELKLEETEKERDQYREEISALQFKVESLKDENTELLNKMDILAEEKKALQTNVEEEKSTLELQRKIEQALKEHIETQAIKINEIEGKLQVTFVDKLLFNTGSAQINVKGGETLLSVADSIREDTQQMLMMEGHTDDVPIGGALQQKFPTNWELSTARATAVVRFLQDRGGIEPQRLAACGYSYYRPVASNDTEAGRSQNRRMEIILVPAP